MAKLVSGFLRLELDEKANVHRMLHTPLLVWVSYFQKDDGQKKAYKTKQSNAHGLVHSKTFFCVTVSTCHRQDQYSNDSCSFTNKDDKDDKDKQISIGLK